MDELRRFLEGLARSGYLDRNLIIVFSDHGEWFVTRPGANLVGLHGVQLEPRGLRIAAIVLLPGKDPSNTSSTLPGTFAVSDLGRLASEFMSRLSSNRPTPLLDYVERGRPLPRRLVFARSVGRPYLGEGVFGGRRTFRMTAWGRETAFWPDGRTRLTSAGLAMLDATADVGWTDGRSLIVLSPLETGGHVAEWYQDTLPVRREYVAAGLVGAPVDNVPTRAALAARTFEDPHGDKLRACPVDGGHRR